MPALVNRDLASLKNLNEYMLLLLRIVRAFSGLFAMIMLKACLQPAIDLFNGESTEGETLFFRAVIALLGFMVFFWLRDVINQIYQSKSESAHSILRSIWSL